MSSKKFGKDKFKVKNEGAFKRLQNTREERGGKEELPKVVFSFKDFDVRQIPPGQSYEDWQNDGLLSTMMAKLNAISQMNIVEALQQEVIKIYSDFPANSEFAASKHISEDVKWAVIMDVGGQKARIAGHVIGNVFHVVFLDKNHRFFITEKKNT
jgi:hypothetical protein